jgi:hypothetical protein
LRLCPPRPSGIGGASLRRARGPRTTTTTDRWWNDRPVSCVTICKVGWEGGRSLLAAPPPSLVSCNGVAGAGYAGVQYRRGGEGGGGSLQHTTREVGLWSVTTQQPHSRQITQRLILRIAG